VIRVRAVRGFVAAVFAIVLGVVLGGGSLGWTASVAAQSADAGQSSPWMAAAAGQFFGARARVATSVSIAAGTTMTLRVVGMGGVPSSGVASVALNLQAKALTTSGEGALIVFPSDGSRVGATGARYRGQIWNDDLLMTKVGADGNVNIENFGSESVTAQVTADVYGYTLTSPGTVPGAAFVGLNPKRIVSGVSIVAGGTFLFSPLGLGGVPASGVSHVVFTLVGTSSQEVPLTVYPSGTTKPADVNLHASPNGNKDNLVIARLGGDGKVAIANGGSSAATVSVDVSGYFATPDAQVQGSVVVPLQPTRLVTKVSIASDSSFTFAPLGQGGVPPGGVSALALDVNVYSTTGTGNVSVYPSGEGPGAWTVGYPTINMWNAGFINAKLGSGGKLVIRNNGSTAVSVWVDVHAYFKPLTGCNPPAGMSAPPASIEPYSRTSVMQASLAPGQFQAAIEYGYIDNIGRVVNAHQSDPDAVGSAQFTVSPVSDAFSGQPALVEQADGLLQLAARNVNGNTWVDPQATKDPATWGAWLNLGGWMASPPVAVRQADGAVAMFALDGSGTLWVLQQDGPNGVYGCWVKTGMTGLAGRVTAVDLGGGTQVFAVDKTGVMKTAFYANRVLSGVVSLGGSGLSGAPAVVVLPGGRMRVFTAATDGSVLTKMQDISGGFPAAWVRVGSLVAQGSPTAVLSPVGRAEVIVRGADGTIYSTGETAQGSGTWRDWFQVSFEQAATDPTAFLYSNSAGPRWAFAYRTADQVIRVTRANEAGAVADGGTPPGPPAFSGSSLPAPPSR
jgi:hypothetical protein